MRLILFIIFLLLNFNAQSQKLRGEILDAENKRPIVAASIFLNNTGIGSVSNEKGVFEISRIPAGKFELIVSCIGYETYVRYLMSSEIESGLKIYLKPKAIFLEEVVVQSYEKDGWNKWGAFFIENFIGVSAYAKEVFLKNPEVVRFKHDKKNQILSAFTTAPLIIENNALGYILRYELVQFEFAFLTQRVIIKGYPFFEEMESDRASKKERWRKNRLDVYEGSMMHFFRSLFRNRVSENGFELRVSVLMNRSEMKRVQDSIRLANAGSNQKLERLRTLNESSFSSISQKDTAAFYSEVLFPTVISADSVAYAIDSVTVGLFFNDYLHVTYVRKKEPVEITQALNGKIGSSDPIINSYSEVGTTSPLTGRPSQGLISKLELIGGKEITVWANGAFYEATDLLSYGYWAFWERIATLLPLDFKSK